MQRQTLDELVNQMTVYMRGIYHGEETIYRYLVRWRRVKCFMLKNSIEYFDFNVGKAYLKSIFGDYNYKNLGTRDKEIVNRIRVLSDFQITGKIKKGPKEHESRNFSGEIGQLIIACIKQREESLLLCNKTVQAHKTCLFQFYDYLNTNGIKRISELDHVTINAYIFQMYPCSPSKKHFSLNLLKIFFRYLSENHIISTDLSKFVPRDSYKHQCKLPSTYSQEEVATLLNSIDRGNAKGKRDFSMLLLAIKFGLRASDICALKFENIRWESSTISLKQLKTGSVIELPLLPEIGNALIDYFKHGRPLSNEKYCFLHTYAPHERMHNYDMGNMVTKYLQFAKIDFSNRHHGPHAFRHSLADNLLKNETALPIITSVLGQTIATSTMHYLKIDIISLRKCALEVPKIPSNFFYHERRILS